MHLTIILKNMIYDLDNQPKHNQFVEHLYEAVSSDGDLITRCHPLI